MEAEVATLRGSGGPPAPPAKTRRNSALPPAKGWKTRRRVARAVMERPVQGRPPGQGGISRPRVPPSQVDVVLPCRPAGCAACRQPLPGTGGTGIGSRQVVELPPGRPVVIAAQRVRRRCASGGHGPPGVSPPGCGALGMFGPRLVATAALLHEEHHVASARLVAVFADLFGLAISAGALVEAVGRRGPGRWR